MATTADPLPDDKDALKTALIEARAKLLGAEALIEHLQLVIAKMKREMFGPRSERSQRLPGAHGATRGSGLQILRFGWLSDAVPGCSAFDEAGPLIPSTLSGHDPVRRGHPQSC